MTVLAGVIAGCGRSSVAPTGTSFVVAQPVSPTNGAQLSFYDQPITVAISNATASTAASFTYRVEVASDPEFQHLVDAKNVDGQTGPRTTIVLSPLRESTTYYWRAKTMTGGATVGPTSNTSRFAVSAPLVILAPTIIEPVADTFPSNRPTFVVANSVATGPRASLQYRFEVADTSTFSGLIVNQGIPEGVGRTELPSPVELRTGGRYYWRVQAMEPKSGVVSPYSATQLFTTVAPIDGTYAYSLVLRVAPDCGNIGSAPRDGVYGFDGILEVSASSLRFRQLGDVPYQHNMTLTLTRTGGHLSGTIGTGPVPSMNATAKATNGFEIGLWDGPYSGVPARFDGSVNPENQELSAAFSANVSIWNQFGDGGGSCRGRFTWTLSPR